MLIVNGRLYRDPRQKLGTGVLQDLSTLGDGVFANSGASRASFGIFLSRVKALSLSVDEQVAMIHGLTRSTFFRWQKLHASKKKLRLKFEAFQQIDVVSELLGLVMTAQENQEAASRWLRVKQGAGPLKGRVPIKELIKGDFAIQVSIRDRLWEEQEGPNLP